MRLTVILRITFSTPSHTSPLAHYASSEALQTERFLSHLTKKNSVMIIKTGVFLIVK